MTHGKRIFKKFLLSGAFLYVVLTLVFYVSVLSRDESVNNIRVQRLNLKMPPHNYLVDNETRPERYDKKKLLLQLEYYERVNKYVPDVPDAMALLAYVYYYYGEKDKAIDYYQRAWEQEPDVFWFPYNLGVIAFKEKQYTDAIEYFKQAVAADPEETLKLVFAGASYKRLMPRVINFKEVIQIRLRDGYAKAMTMRILSRYYLKDYQNMYRDATYALAMDIGQEARFYYYAGVAAFRQKQYQKASHSFEESIKINPDQPEPFYYLSLCAKALGREGDALAALNVGLRINEKKKAEEAAHPSGDPMEDVFFDFGEEEVYLNVF